MRIPLTVALVFVAACADPVAPPDAGDADRRQDPWPADHSSDPVDVLLSATVFETPSRGLSLSDPPNWVAWRDVLLGETAASDFRYLYETATTPEGRMYGAAGMLAADPEAWMTLAADPRWGEAEVTYQSGCIGWTVPAPMLLRTLATPEMREYFRTGQYPVEGS